MKNDKNHDTVKREQHFTQQSGQLITNKKDIKTIVAIILIILAIIINVIMGFWFNHKLNRMNSNLYKEINNSAQTSATNTNDKKFNYGPLHAEQPNYSAKTEYAFYENTYIDLSGLLKDENGVRLVVYNNEKKYNPVSIAQYGLREYGNWINTSEEENLNNAKIQADYLLKIQDKENGKFYYDYDFKVGGTRQTLKAPWSSAMAQGQIISLFSRMYYVTEDEKYLQGAKLAMTPLKVNVEDGGLCADFFGHPYYEEYPTIPSTYTLNGFMFTLLGLHDLYSISGDEQAKQLYDNGIETLEYCLPFYDSTGISLYHLGHIMDKNLPLHYAERYHIIHVGLLRILNRFENNATLMYYADRWAKYVEEN